MRALHILGSCLAAFATALACSAPALADDRVVLGGGSPIVVGRHMACTLTAIGHDRSGSLVGITAGFCGDAGSDVIAEESQEAGELGTVVRTDDHLAFGVIQFNPKKVAPTATVGDFTITGFDPAPLEQGDTVCKLGRSTGWTCGSVLRAGESNHLAELCIRKGDAGAPVVRGSKLVGMVTHYYNDTPCEDNEGGVNIGAILEALGPGAGDDFQLQKP
ncbi:MAG: peptidase S1 [Segniliparus sp.]|uniref:peptidase S1 n=1 Tax=Segniliparus sp. TaxID=2804064 RepID=UPI003F3C737D